MADQKLLADLQKLASVAKEKFQLSDMALKDIHILDSGTLYECLQRTPIPDKLQPLFKTLIFGFIRQALEQNTLDQPTSPRPHNLEIETLMRKERRGKLLAAPVGKNNDLRLVDMVWLGEATGHIQLDEHLRTNIIVLVLEMLDGAFAEFIKSNPRG